MADGISIELGVKLNEGDLSDVQSKIDALKGKNGGGKVRIEIDKTINSQIANLKRTLDSVVAKPYKIDIQINQQIVKDMKSLTDELNKAASNLQRYKANISTTTGARNPTVATPSSKTGSVGSGYPNVGLLSSKFVDDVAVSRLKKINQELGKTHTIIQELDEDGNVTKTIDKYTNNLDLQVKALEKTKDILSKRQSDLNEKAADAFKRNEPLTDSFAKPVEDQIDRIQTKIDGLNSSGLVASAKDIRELNEEFRKLDTLIKDQHALQYSNTKLKSVDTRESVERYISALNQLENKQKSMGLLTTEMQTNIETIRNGFASVGKEDGGALDKWVDKFGTLKQKIDEFASSTQGKGLRLAFNIDENELQKLTNLTENEIIKSGTTPGIEKLRENINILKNEYANISEQLKSEDLTDAQFSALSARLDELRDKFTQVAGAAKVYQDGFKNEQAIEKFKEDQKILVLQLDRVQQKYNEIKSANKDLADPALEQQLLSLKNKIENVDPTNIGLVRKELQEVRTAVNGLQPPMQSFSQMLSQNFGGLGQYLSRFTSTVAIIGRVVSATKKMVAEVKSIDTSLVELQKVTSLAGNALDEFTDKAYNVGKGLGRTGQDVIDATTTFSRAGYDLQEATELAQSALVMTNVGVDIPNMESAASDMISILKAFDKQADESMDVIDKLYNVANKEPLDFGNITQMLVTAGGTLAQTNTSLEETMGLLTGAFATMRDTSVANGLIMISQRLRGVAEDGEALEDGFMPKLEKMFSEIGISIQDENGELRSTYNILNDLAEKWDTLSSKQRQYFGEKVAGNRQVKTLNAIMANWDVVQDTIDKANNSAGAAMEGNELFMDSIEGRIVQFKSAFQDLTRTTINSDLIKWIVSLGSEILNITNNIGGLVPVITTVLGLLTAFKSLKIQKSFGDFIKGLSFSFKGGGIGSALGKIGLFVAALTTLSVVIKKISESISLFNKIGDAKTKYQSAIDSMNAAQSQLTGVRERISQIKSLGELSFVEEQELANLEKTSAQLELQYETQKKIAEVQKQMVESNFGALMSNFAGYTSGYGGVDALNSVAQWFGNSMLGRVIGEDLNLFGIDINNEDWGKPDKQLFEEAINAFNNAQTEITKTNQDIYNNMYNGLADGMVSQAVQDNKDRRLQAFTDFSKAMSILEKYKAAAEGIERNSITEPFFQEIDAMETALSDAMQYALDLDDALITPFQEILSSSEFSEVSSELVNLAESGQLTNESFSNVDGVDAFLNAIGKLGISTEQAVGFLNKLYNEAESQPNFIMPERVAAEVFTATDAYKTLTAAMQEQQKAGVLSAETWAKLINSESGLPGIEKCLELTANGYALNTEKAYDFLEVQNRQNKIDAVRGLKEQRDALTELSDAQAKLYLEGKEGSEEWIKNLDQEKIIQAEIDKYSALIREIDASTDALARYNAAKQTSNQDANFNVGQNALKDVQEGLKSGKIGTDDFKTAVDFVLGDNWEDDLSRFGGDVNKAYSEAQKLGERYFGGKDEKKNAMNFMNDLVSKGFGEWDGDNFKLIGGTLKEMADSLGISEEAARSLFGLLEAYGGKFEFPEILTEQDLENLKQLDIEESQKALEDLINKKEELVEKQNNTEVDSDEYKQLETEINSANNAISVLEENIENGGNIAEGLSITEAISKLSELQEAINTLNAEGIDVPVQLLNQYDDLVSLIDRLNSGTNSEGESATSTDNTLEVTYSGSVDASINTVDEKLNDVAKDRTVNYKAGEVELPTVDNEFSRNGVPKESVPFAGLSGRKATLAYQMAEEIEDFKREIASLSTNNNADKQGQDGLELGNGLSNNEPVSFDLTFPSNEVKESTTEAVQEAQEIVDSNPVEFSIENKGEDPLIGLGEDTLGLHELATSAGVAVGEVSDLSFAYVRLSNARDDYNKAVNENPDGAGDALSKYKEELSGFIELYGQVKSEFEENNIGFDFSEVDTELSQLQNEITDGETYKIDGDASELDTVIDDADARIRESETKPIGADASSAYAEINNLRQEASTPITIPVSIGGPGPATTERYASGTKRAKDGIAIVDENGAELIEHVKDGTFEIGTDNGARFVELNSGDIVHTAGETEKILKRNGKKGRAFASGTVNKKGLFGAITQAIGAAVGAVGQAISQTTQAVTTSIRPTGGMDAGRLRHSSGSGSGGGGGRHGGGGSSGSSGGENEFQNWASKLFDWIEIRLDKLKKKTDGWIKAAEKAIGYAAKNKQLDKAIASIQTEIEATTSAYDEYMHTAQEVAEEAGLSAEMIQKIKDGVIDVESLDTDMQEKIQEYQEWYERAQDCREALSELRDQQAELSRQKLDNIISHYDARTSMQQTRTQIASTRIDLKKSRGQKITKDDYKAEIKSENKRLKLLTKEHAALEEQLESSGIKKYSDEWWEYKNRLAQIEQEMAQTELSVQELENEMNRLKLDKLAHQFDLLSGKVNNYEKSIQLINAQGKSLDKTIDIYKDLISTEESSIQVLKAQRQELENLRNSTERGSDEYYELTQQIQDVDSSLMDAQIAIEDYQRAIDDVTITKIEAKLNRLSQLNDELNKKMENYRALGKSINKNAEIYNQLIENDKSRIAYLEKELELWREEKDQVEVNSERYIELNDNIRRTRAEIIDLEVEIIDFEREANKIDLTKLGWKLDKLAAKASKLQGTIDLHSAQGIEESADTYMKLIENGMKQINILEKENEKYRSLQQGLSKTNEDYQEFQSQINANLDKINQMMVAQEGWNDAIMDLEIDKIQKFREALSKTNEEYKKQKEFQEAIEDLQRAQDQRTLRVYRSGVGFTYEADQEKIKSAQEKLEDVIRNQLLDKMDDLIEAIEAYKDDINVYDAEGNLIGSQVQSPQLDNLQAILQRHQDEIHEQSVGYDWLSRSIADQVTSRTNNSTNMQFGDIVLNDVNDVNTLAHAIINQLPNALLQAMNRE